jgi:TPR repeat protein
MYENGSGVPKDPAEAVKWCRKAAEQGYAAAQHNLGVCYLTGTGVAQDAALTLQWFRKAAAQGDEGAAAEVARLTAASRRAS